MSKEYIKLILLLVSFLSLMALVYFATSKIPKQWEVNRKAALYDCMKTYRPYLGLGIDQEEACLDRGAIE